MADFSKTFGHMETHRYTNSFAIIYQRGRGNSESLFRASLFNYTRWLISSSDDLLAKKKKEEKFVYRMEGSTVIQQCTIRVKPATKFRII